MPGNIIIFDDEPDVRDAIFEILTNADYKVLIADSESINRSCLVEFKPDLIISDIMMPCKSGYDVYKELKSIEDICDVPFIFLTAKSDYSDIRTGMNLGADDYILKPFRAKDLLHSVELRIRKNRRIRELLDNFSESVALHIPHELRTPLSSLLSYSEVILNEYNTLNDKEILHFTGIINSSAKRLHRTIEKFILYSDLLFLELESDVKNKYFTKSETQIDHLIKDVSKITAKKHNRGEDLSLNLTPHSIELSEDAIRIIITELLENSFKYSQPDTLIEIRGELNGDEYLVSITDKGIGMSNDQIARLRCLQQFERGIVTQDGNGLGLAIVDKVLSILASRLNIFSTPQIGTTVSFGLKAKK